MSNVRVIRLANGQPPADPNQAPQPGDWVQDGPVQKEWAEPESLSPEPTKVSGDKFWFRSLFTPTQKAVFEIVSTAAAQASAEVLIANPALLKFKIALAEAEAADLFELKSPTLQAYVREVLTGIFVIGGQNWQVLTPEQAEVLLTTGKQPK